MKDFKDMWEDAAANSVAGGGVSLPADAMGKNAQKKKKKIYDGRTREGKKFVERILARRTARAEAKVKTEEVSEKYRKPTQAEIDADRKKDQKGKKRPSATSKSIGNKLYKNLRNQTEMKGAEEWQKYAELLAIKSKLIKGKNKPSSAAIVAVNKKINALLRKIGVTEEDAKLHLEALSKYNFRYYRTNELELKNRAYGYDVEQAFKKAGYDVYGGDLSVKGSTIRFNRYSKHWGTNEKKLKAVIKKVLGIDVDRL